MTPAALRPLRPYRQLHRRFENRALAFTPGTATAAGRSLLALAQLVALLCTPDSALLAADGLGPVAPRCDGARALGLWCLGPADGTLTVRRILAAAALLAVAAGWQPRWTCLLHWYLTLSLATATAIGDAGDDIARITTLLLLPVLLGDPRRWHWQRLPDGLPARRRGPAAAAHLLLRLQVVIVYLHAALSKAGDPIWRQGTAMYYWLHSHYWGAPEALAGPLAPVLDHRWTVGALGWTVIAVEFAIAAAMLAPGRTRSTALPLAIALHGGIILLMGLFGFGLTMIATVLIACDGSVSRFRCTTDVTDWQTDGPSGATRAATRRAGARPADPGGWTP